MSSFSRYMHEQPARMTTGEPYQSRPSGVGVMMSCIRCGRHRILSELVSDQRVRGQRRCRDRDACSAARARTAC